MTGKNYESGKNFESRAKETIALINALRVMTFNSKADYNARGAQSGLLVDYAIALGSVLYAFMK